MSPGTEMEMLANSITNNHQLQKIISWGSYSKLNKSSYQLEWTLIPEPWSYPVNDTLALWGGGGKSSFIQLVASK